MMIICGWLAGWVDDRLLAAPLSRGAGVITSLVRADGIVILPRGVQGLEAGAKVRVRLYRSPAELERTILAIGSHDMTLDLLAQYLAQRGRRLVSANVGSLGGLVALRRGEAHLAGSHLLDPQTGEYNLSYIRQYLPDTPVHAGGLGGAGAGAAGAAGQPEGDHRAGGPGARGCALCQPPARRGHARPAGLPPRAAWESRRIRCAGYDQEEYTHLAVAAAVSLRARATAAWA